MSEPKRYTLRMPDISYGMREGLYGEYVRYEDYARLKAEVERLELEVFAFDRTIKQASCHYDNRLEDIRQLQAEVDKLTKAGDAMACHLVCSDLPNDVCGDLMKNWNAAKEGKQS